VSGLLMRSVWPLALAEEPYKALSNKSGSLAMLAAMRRAS